MMKHFTSNSSRRGDEADGACNYFAGSASSRRRLPIISNGLGLVLRLALLAGMAAALPAQTTVPTSVVGPHLTRIWSDSGYFDINNHTMVYTGNVRVDDPQLKMTCDKLTARTPENGGRVDSVVGEGHVVMDIVDQSGQTNHATGDKLVYTYKVVNSVTNDTAVLTGHPPRVDTASGWTTGTKITFDRVTGRLYVDMPVMGYNQSLTGATNRVATTNAPAITNVPPMTNALMVTNVPPLPNAPVATKASGVGP